MKGNLIASLRYRVQTYTKDTDEPCESEWFQFKADAIKEGAVDLVRQFKKFGKDELVVKIFNQMNYKEQPTVITLEEAMKLIQPPTN